MPAPNGDSGAHPLAQRRDWPDPGIILSEPRLRSPMAGSIDARLKELGIVLPEPAAPQANYVGNVVTGNLIFTAGQIPLRAGKVEFVGKLGKDMTVEQGYEAAKLCAINVLAQVKVALGGDLGRVVRCVKLLGF